MSRYPDNEATIARLRSVIEASGGKVLSFERLVELAKPESVLTFALVVADLVSSKQLAQIVRVESRDSSGGIGDFPSLLDVPDRINDWRAGVEFDVEPDDLKVFYRVPT